jgi:hypothetical protein
MVPRALVVMQLCSLLPGVPVPVETANKLTAIAELEDTTVSAVIRAVLEGFADGYQPLEPASIPGPGLGPSSN